MPGFASQLIRARNLALSANSQTAIGTALADAAITHGLRFNADAFSPFPEKDYWSDRELAKGHPWVTALTEISRKSGIQISNLAIYDFLAGWLAAFLFGKESVTGAGPYVHTFVPDLTTTLAKVTTLGFQDTADVAFKLQDMAVAALKFSGGAIGPVLADVTLMGTGRSAAAMASYPALVAPSIIKNNDADILMGASGAAVSIKERVRNWAVTFNANLEDYRHPGSGVNAGFLRRGDLMASLQLSIAAKDVDDIQTLLDNDTAREVQINIDSGSANKLHIKFPKVIFKGSRAADGLFITYNLEADETRVFKLDASTDPFIVEVTNSQPTYLVAA
jgi:hypothetical protein